MTTKPHYKNSLAVTKLFDGTILINLEIVIPRFEEDPDHIKWLCEAHEWLRPYFPFWRGVF